MSGVSGDGVVAGSPLRLGHAQGAPRWLLEDKPLVGGDVVQLCCSGGWLTGRFECDAGTGNAPTFFFTIEIAGGRVEPRSLVLPDGALLRRA